MLPVYLHLIPLTQLLRPGAHFHTLTEKPFESGSFKVIFCESQGYFIYSADYKLPHCINKCRGKTELIDYLPVEDDK